MKIIISIGTLLLLVNDTLILRGCNFFFACVSARACVRVRVCACVRERERESE